MRVLRAEDDMLFLVGGSNDVVRLFSACGFASIVPIAAWRRRLAAREAFFAARGIPWCQLLVPEKLAVRGDAVLAQRVPGARAPGARLIEAVGHPALVYPLTFLRAQIAQGYTLYPRTDSHWTSLGAFCAFQWLLPRLGVTVDFSPYQATAPVAMSYRGDLWGDGYPDFAIDSFERRAVPAHIVRSYANPIVRLKERLGIENEAGLHVGSHVAFRNVSAERPERLLLFGSSFSEYRAECALLTFIAALFFREVHFVWSSSLDLVLVDRLGPDLAIIEMPERFIGTCPADDFDLGAHETEITAAWSAPVISQSGNPL